MPPRFKKVAVRKDLTDAIEEYGKCKVKELSDLNDLRLKLVKVSKELENDVNSQNARGNYFTLSQGLNGAIEDWREEEILLKENAEKTLKNVKSLSAEYIKKDGGNIFKRNLIHHMSQSRVNEVAIPIKNSTERLITQINELPVENQDTDTNEQNSPLPESIHSDDLHLLDKCISYVNVHINNAKKNPHYFLDVSYNRRIMNNFYSLLSIFNKILENHEIRLKSTVHMMNYTKNFKIDENSKSNCNELYNELDKAIKDIVKVKKPSIVQNLINDQIFPLLTSLKEIINQSKEQICYTENLHSKINEKFRMLNRNYPLSQSFSVEDIYSILSSLIDMIGTLESGGSPKPYFSDKDLPATNFKERIQNYGKFFYDMKNNKNEIIKFLNEFCNFYCTGSSGHRMNFLFPDEEDEINKWCKRIVDDIEQDKIDFKDD